MKYDPKNSQLDECRLGVTQIENRLKMWDHRVVQDSTKTPRKEQRRHHGHGAIVGMVRRMR